jgi:iron complex outermembrane receptor protein
MPKVRQHQWSVYGQDEIHFFDDDVRFTLGAKLEDLEFTGLAFQPTVRGLWRVTDSHTIWTAASRAVRTPSRIELHAQTELGFYSPDGLVMARVIGDEDLKAEDLRAYELGWRWRPYRALSIDVALYRNEYEHLIDGDELPSVFEPGPPPRLVLPSVFANIDHTRVDGAEVVAEWAARDWLRLEAQGTWLDSRAARGGRLPGPIDPQRMFMLRARFDLPRDIELDLAWRSVSDLAGLGVDGYHSLNARTAWRPVENIELSLSIENALDNEHIEFDDNLAFLPGATLGRGYFARLTWQPR